MKIKTNVLEGMPLDWAVAKCEGASAYLLENFTWRSTDEDDEYSTDWSQGGPIIEREEITVGLYDTNGDDVIWFAGGHDGLEFFGPTPLIASMRWYVSSKLGDEVEVPDVLQEV